MSEREDAARMEVGADAWHQDEEGQYYMDCPECGSAATLSNVVNHNRCNGYLDQQESDTELDEEGMTCTAVLSLELVYHSDPEDSMDDPAVDDGDVETGAGEHADSDPEETG